jgi:hypothetical protein
VIAIARPIASIRQVIGAEDEAVDDNGERLRHKKGNQTRGQSAWVVATPVIVSFVASG